MLVERVYSDNIAKEKSGASFESWPLTGHVLVTNMKSSPRKERDTRSAIAWKQGYFHAIFILSWRTELLRVVLDQKHFYSATGEST